VRIFLKNQLYALVYAIVHTIFSVYIRFRQAYHAVKDRILSILYYHHRTPELIRKDVRGLSRLPQHISVILKLEDGGRGGAGLEALVDEAAEIAAWCACIGIPMLSIYEKTGQWNQYICNKLILIRSRNFEGICSSNTYSNVKKAILISWTTISGFIFTSTSYRLHGIRLKDTYKRNPWNEFTKSVRSPIIS